MSEVHKYVEGNPKVLLNLDPDVLYLTLHIKYPPIVNHLLW